MAYNTLNGVPGQLKEIKLLIMELIELQRDTLAEMRQESVDEKPLCPQCNGLGKVRVKVRRNIEIQECKLCGGTGIKQPDYPFVLKNEGNN